MKHLLILILGYLFSFVLSLAGLFVLVTMVSDKNLVLAVLMLIVGNSFHTATDNYAKLLIKNNEDI